MDDDMAYSLMDHLMAWLREPRTTDLLLQLDSACETHWDATDESPECARRIVEQLSALSGAVDELWLLYAQRGNLGC